MIFKTIHNQNNYTKKLTYNTNSFMNKGSSKSTDNWNWILNKPQKINNCMKLRLQFLKIKSIKMLKTI